MPGQVEDVIVEVISPPPVRPLTPFNLEPPSSPIITFPKRRKLSATVEKMFSSESYEERRQFGTADVINTLGIVTNV